MDDAIRSEERVTMAIVSQRERSRSELAVAFQRIRDPVLLLAFPVVFAVLLIVWGWLPAWGIGFDFVGTLWGPAREILDGGAIYPEPTRASILIGNPSVYPPPAIVTSIPLALLPEAVAGWIWFCVLGAAVLAALWILGIRDWRCFVVAVTSPVVVQGLVFGNLTILLVLAIAVVWRYRDATRTAGITLGAALGAKFVVWPLLAWLLMTKRYRAAAWATGSAVVLVAGVWAALGFEGLADYPTLLQELQDVYATRSISLGTVAAGFGASQAVAVALCWIAGLALVGLAVRSSRRGDGDRRAFPLVVGACIVASPIVWPYYTAFLFVPIAIAWPTFGPAWLFGYAVWLVGVVMPKSTVDPSDVCCRPEGVPEQAWVWSHADPSPWYAAGVMAIVLAVTWSAARTVTRGRVIPARAARSLES
jgi:alpha-1,2-mannosyltransferase